MKIKSNLRFSLSLFLLLSLLLPVTLLAAVGDGKKFFKEGLKHEIAEEWDQAAEDFALAVADNPKNPEYRLHYRRALFNASQMYMKRGRSQAEQGDYGGAYIAFRKAYAYDPVNELAKSEMERMLRLQKKLINGDAEEKSSSDDVRLINAGLTDGVIPSNIVIPQKYDVLTDVPFPTGIDLEYIVRKLAKDLDINVLFDTSSFRTPRRVKIDLKNVTAAKALDYIFLQEGLFFEKVGPRTILVANSNRRQFFEQLVLQTFYLANADPKDVAALIKQAIPAQPGRTPTNAIVDEDTNSITIRDTAENIRLFGKLIKTLDKDRAEVVMDVQIYEVSKSDLLQLGNQFGTGSSLLNLGGTSSGIVSGGNRNAITDILGIRPPTALGIGLLLPGSSIIALQRKNNTKLIASTQIHAFNNEDSTARIGQRVPVQTASVIPFSGGNTTGGGNNTGNAFGNGFPVINYEQVGLTLKFKPIVFPNHDVQVSMEIESKEVVNAGSLTPTFTERKINGTARIQNNKTLLLASVAQGVESRGREGLPFLGLIPIIGRLFTAPTRDNREIDIVIAVTPRVIRAPAILPEDLVERQTGSLAVPTSSNLEALLIREEIEEQLALARRLPKNPTVQLPDQKLQVPSYVKTNGQETVSKNTPEKTVVTENKSDVAVKENTNTSDTPAGFSDSSVGSTTLRPINSGVKTLNLKETALKTKGASIKSETIDTNAPTATLQFLPKFRAMKAGEKTKFAIMVRSAKAFRSAVLGLKFNESLVAIRSISYGDVFGANLAQTEAKPFLNQNGKLYVSLSSPKDVSENSSGIMAYIEIEALKDGTPNIEFDADILNMLTAEGDNFVLNF
ncbi:MAG: secretin N-terminal domain-containing protein [Aridibacter sp.]